MSDEKYPVNVLINIDSEDLLKELARRGGHPGALAEAALLCIRKSADYNHGKGTNPHTVDRSVYFPFGNVSHAQMLFTKALRFVSLVEKELGGAPPNFEGLQDTALDIINYGGFYIAHEWKKQRALEEEHYHDS